MAERRDIRRDLILETARDLFALNGVRRATMGDIAQKAGVGKPVLYQYFSSKDDIITAVIDMEIEFLKASLSQGLDEEENPMAQIARAWSNAIDFYEKDNFLMHILRANELGLAPYMHERYVMEIETFVVGLLESLIRGAINEGTFVECNSRIAAYMGYKIYQAGTYGRTDTLKEFSSKDIMKKTMLIMALGIMDQKRDQKIF